MKHEKQERQVTIFLIITLAAFVLLLCICGLYFQTSGKDAEFLQVSDEDAQTYGQEYVSPRVGEGDISIDETNFPDPVFRSWLSDARNLNGAGSDGILTAEERGAVLSIHIEADANAQVHSLEGIALFPALQELSVTNHALTQLDLTGNTALQYVNCSYNRLTELKVANLSSLTAFYCEFNYLTELDLTGLINLSIIYCRHNLLESLDFSTNLNLKFIETFDNRLTEIDVSMLKQLEFLHIDHNRLQRLDMSGNPNLQGGGFVVRNNDCRELILPDIPDFTVYYDDFAEQDPIDGYERLEWYFDSDYTQPVTGDVQANGQTLYGKRVANAYTIRFSGNGGINLPASVQTCYDMHTALPSLIPQREGYTFEGWGDDAYNPRKIYPAGSEVINLAGRRRDGEYVTLYAVWSPVSYTISFHANADGATGSMQTVTAQYGTEISLPQNGFSRDGYDFVGWATSPGGAAVFADMQTVLNLTSNSEEVRLYAVWELTVEEIVGPYLDRLDNLYRSFTENEYFAEDGNTLQGYYLAARDALNLAGKDKTQMERILSSCEADFANVMTREERISEIVLGWTGEFSDILEKLNAVPVPFGQGAAVYAETLEALRKAERQNLAEYSTLTQSESRTSAAIAAGQQLSAHTQKLLLFSSVGEWMTVAEDAGNSPLSEVTSYGWDIYDSLLGEAELFTPEQSAFVSEQLLDALNVRLNLAESKQYALGMLENVFLQFKQEQYDADDWQTLVGIRNSAATAIESAQSHDKCLSLVTEAEADMSQVPVINLPEPEPDPDQPDPELPDPDQPDPDQPDPDLPEQQGPSQSEGDGEGQTQGQPDIQEPSAQGKPNYKVIAAVCGALAGVSLIAAGIIIFIKLKK